MTDYEQITMLEKRNHRLHETLAALLEVGCYGDGIDGHYCHYCGHTKRRDNDVHAFNCVYMLAEAVLRDVEGRVEVQA